MIDRSGCSQRRRKPRAGAGARRAPPGQELVAAALWLVRRVERGICRHAPRGRPRRPGSPSGTGVHFIAPTREELFKTVGARKPGACALARGT
ncbi:hypothetical protein ACTMU2_39425 [Cupriavidus basilensis]